MEFTVIFQYTCTIYNIQVNIIVCLSLQTFMSFSWGTFQIPLVILKYWVNYCHLLSFFLNYLFIHMCIHCLGHFSPLPLPPPSSSPLHFQAEPVLHFSPVPLKSRNKQLIILLWYGVIDMILLCSCHPVLFSHPLSIPTLPQMRNPIMFPTSMRSICTKARQRSITSVDICKVFDFCILILFLLKWFYLWYSYIFGFL
jgi:hypothetical protein